MAKVCKECFRNQIIRFLVKSGLIPDYDSWDISFKEELKNGLDNIISKNVKE